MLLAIITILLVIGITYFMPKRMTALEMYSTSLFAITLSCYADMYLSMDYHLYDYFEEGMDYTHVIIQVGIYPFINMIYLNFYPFAGSITRKALYIIGWSSFATAYEWVALQTSFFHHDNWRLLYSAAIYPFLFILLLANFHFITALEQIPKKKSDIQK